jgi:hypothetical protein
MEATVLAIQQFYPQVFHACHVAHTRARSNEFRLSERGLQLLAKGARAMAQKEQGS